MPLVLASIWPSVLQVDNSSSYLSDILVQAFHGV